MATKKKIKVVSSVGLTSNLVDEVTVVSATTEERDRLINLLNYKLKSEFAYVPIRSVINIADYLLAKGVKVAQSKGEESQQTIKHLFDK